jgi:hypothetical protein
MVWQVKFGFRAANDLRLLGFQDAREVLGYLSRWIAPSEDPRRVGCPCRIGRARTAPDAIGRTRTAPDAIGRARTAPDTIGRAGAAPDTRAGQWRYEVGGIAMAVKIVDAAHGGPVVWVLALWRTR